MQAQPNVLDTLLDHLLRSGSLRVGLRELKDGEVVYLADSRLTAELLGGTPEETAGRTARELGLPPAFSDACKALLAQSASSGTPVHGVLTIDTAAGPRELACTVVPVPGTSRQLVFVDEKRGGRDSMFAALVHELGNPMFAVLANLELVMRQLQASGAAGDLIDAVADALTAADQACDVLDTMRSLAYPTDAAVTAPLAPLVREVIAAVTAELGGDAAPVIVDGPIPEVAAVTGRSAARQILINLVRNAVAAGRRAGVDAPVELGARVEGDTIVVSIRDRGPGIEPALAPRLFAPFASGRADGTGLGLFVSRALAERIGASVELRDRDDGPGAIARLTLRAA